MALPFDLDARLDLYAKRMQGLYVVPDATDSDRRVAIDRLQSADARVRGLDLTIRRTTTEGLSGWLGYTYLSAMTVTGQETYPETRQPRNRLVTVLDWTRGRWRFNTRFEAYEGLPYTPAIASFASRPLDLGNGGLASTQCDAVSIDYLYGSLNSARTGISKRMDVSARYRRNTHHGWSYELGFSIYNALFDSPGIFRPAHSQMYYRPQGCQAPVAVQREPEIRLPAIPSVTLRTMF